jgi:hypothetical protein
MKSYTEQQKYYCGIDLDTRKMYVFILDDGSNIPVHL